MQSYRSSRSARRRRGFTLIEVVAGISLMASLLVAALLSFSSHRQQLRRASDTIAAVALADDLLLQLTGQRTGVPVSAAGALPGTRGWIWRTSPAGVVAPMQLPMQVIRLEIIDPLRSIDDRVLASVEVVRSRS